MDRRQMQVSVSRVARAQREADAIVEREDALEITVLCLVLVISVVGVGLLATVVI